MLANRMRMLAQPGGGGETQYSISLNGISTSINVGSDSSIDDLHDGAFTVEAWIKADGWGELSNQARIFSKTNGTAEGWRFDMADVGGDPSFGGIRAAIFCSTTAAAARSGEANFSADGTWYHVSFTWDDASYSYPRIWINGTEQTNSTQSRSGAVVTDASNDLYIGNRSANDATFDGDIAWARISDNIRWTTTFTPDAKDAPPATDGNTVALWTMNEGTGTNVEDVSANTNDGTLSNGSWVEL